MAIWFTLLLFAASFALSQFLQPGPDIENARPAGLGQFQFPTATEGRVIPLVWGTTLVKGPNVVWHGDLVPEAITERVKTNLWSSKKVIVGFRYKLGVQMGVCRGSDDDTTNPLKFLRVFVGEKEFANSDGSNPLGASGLSEGSVSFANDDFLGGEDNGKGGISGTVTFRPGSRTQSIPAYLRAQQALTNNKTPRYTGTGYALLERVNLGTSPQIDPWWFEVQRMPDPVGLGGNNRVNGGKDLNPVSAIAEILLNQEWGMRQTLGKINVSNFQSAGATLFSEENGFSYAQDTEIEAGELLRNIERQIDGVLFQDRSTGLWTINLARESDTSVLALDESNVLEVQRFARASFDDTANQVLTPFQSRAREYADSYGREQDLGNITQRGGTVVSRSVNYTGVKNEALANQLAARDLLTFSYPLASAKLVVNRQAWVVNPTDVVTWSSEALGIVGLEFRVTRINFNTLLDGRITLDLVENIFALGQSSNTAGDAGEWTPPVAVLEAYNADNPPEAVIIEAPRAFVERDPDSPALFPRLWFGARNKGDGALVYDLTDVNGNVDGTASAFLVQGELDSALAISGGSSAVTFEIVAGASAMSEILAALEDVSSGEVGSNLAQLILIGDEIIGVESVTDLGTSIRVDVGYRGFLDTVPAAHSSGDAVYVLSAGGNLTETVFASGARRIITEALGSIRLAGASAYSDTVTLEDRFNSPYPPAQVTWNGSDFPASIDFGLSQSGIPFSGRGARIGFVRRDFRLGDEVAKHDDESSLPADFPGANTTEYRVTANPDAGSTVTGAWASAVAGPLDFSRANLIWEFNANPSSIEWTFEVRHTVDGSVISGRSVVHTTSLTGTQAGKTFVQRLDNLQVGNFTAPDSGSYAFDIFADLLNGGIVEAQINGGGYSTVISSGGSSGTLAGVTAGDSIDFRHTGVDGDAVFALLVIDPPSSTGYVAPLRI